MPYLGVTAVARAKGVSHRRVKAAMSAGLLKYYLVELPSGRLVYAFNEKDVDEWDGSLHPAQQTHKTLRYLTQKYGVSYEFVYKHLLRCGRLNYLKIAGKVYICEEEFIRALELFKPLQRLK